jgi:hypothetical protein
VREAEAGVAKVARAGKLARATERAERDRKLRPQSEPKPAGRLNTNFHPLTPCHRWACEIVHVYVDFSLDFWGKVWYNEMQLGKREVEVLLETMVLGGASSAPLLGMSPEPIDGRKACRVVASGQRCY